MKNFVIALFMVITCSTRLCGAESTLPKTLTLEDGTVYEDVRLLSQTPSDIVFIHSGGAKNLKKSELPLDIQQKLDFSPESAESYETQKALEAEERLKESEAKSEARKNAKALKAYIKNNTFMIRGEIQEINSDGILLNFSEPSDFFYGGIVSAENEKDSVRFKRYSTSRPKREFGSLFITGHPYQKSMSDGDLIDINAYRDGTQRVGTITARKYIFLESFE